MQALANGIKPSWDLLLAREHADDDISYTFSVCGTQLRTNRQGPVHLASYDAKTLEARACDLGQTKHNGSIPRRLASSSAKAWPGKSSSVASRMQVACSKADQQFHTYEKALSLNGSGRGASLTTSGAPLGTLTTFRKPASSNESLSISPGAQQHEISLKPKYMLCLKLRLVMMMMRLCFLSIS